MSENSFRYLRKGEGTSRFGRIKYPKFTKLGQHQFHQFGGKSAVPNLNMENVATSSSTVDSGRFTSASSATYYHTLDCVVSDNDIGDKVKHRGILQDIQSPIDSSFIFRRNENVDKLETQKFETLEKATAELSLNSNSSFYQHFLNDDIKTSGDLAKLTALVENRIKRVLPSEHHHLSTVREVSNENLLPSEKDTEPKVDFYNDHVTGNAQSMLNQNRDALRDLTNFNYDFSNNYGNLRFQQYTQDEKMLPENHHLLPSTSAKIDENLLLRRAQDLFYPVPLSNNGENRVHFNPVNFIDQQRSAVGSYSNSVETGGGSKHSDPSLSTYSSFDRLRERLNLPQFSLPPQPIVTKQRPNVSKESEKQQYLLQTKILEEFEEKLETMILTLTKDTEKLEAFRDKLDGTEKLLDSDKEKLKNERLEFDSFVAEEMRKIDKERNLLSKEKTGTQKKQQEQMSLLRQQILDLQDETVQRDSRISGSRAKIRELENDLAVVKEENETLRLRYRNLEDNSAKLEKENAHLRNKNWTLKQQQAQVSTIGANRLPLVKSSSETTVMATTPKLSCLTNNNVVNNNNSKVGTSSTKSVRFLLPDESPAFRRTEDRCIQTSVVDNDYCSYGEVENEISTQTSLIVDTPRHVTIPKYRLSNSSNRADLIDQTLERRRSDGSKEIIHSSGTVEEVDPQGRTIMYTYPNGDSRKFEEGGIEVYYFSSSNVTQIRSPTGIVIVRYKDGREEKHFPDGSVEITTKDGVKRYVNNGIEKVEYPDGTISEQYSDGSMTVKFLDGSKETRTSEFTKREFPNGDVKFRYKDGSEETRLVSGRIRLKNSKGEIVKDE